MLQFINGLWRKVRRWFRREKSHAIDFSAGCEAAPLADEIGNALPVSADSTPEPEPQPQPAVEPQPQTSFSWPQPPNVPKPKRVSAKRKREAVSRQNLSELLDGLEQTFKNVATPMLPLSYNYGMSNDTRIGLRRLGAHVPESGRMLPGFDGLKRARFDGTEPLTVRLPDTSSPYGAKWSAMMLVSLSREANDSQHRLENDPEFKADIDKWCGKASVWGSMTFMYAVRHQKLPWDVEQVKTDAVYYECGAAFKFNKKGIQWACFWVVIDKATGEVRIAKQRLVIPVSVGSCNYARKDFGIPIAHGQDHWGSDEEVQRMLATDFCLMFDWWHEKDSMWSVVVRKAGDRVTFCIPESSAKDYFKDRGKTALTAAGKRRPIFHIVSEHERVLADGRTTTVKSHARGLREFDWRDFTCKINAPSLHWIPSVQFDLPAYDEDEPPIGVKPVYLSKVGQMVADMENDGSMMVPKDER